jgi:eukaryotic-like serine/threonine-protein kinase
MPDARRRLTPADLYRRAWAAGLEPELSQFLAGLADLTPDDLLEVIEIDRSERWRRGHRVSAERYLKTFPSLKADEEAALVVIYGEFYLRKELDESPSLLEYVARFPKHAPRLRDQVMWNEAIDMGPPSSAGPPRIPGLEVGELLGRGGMCSVYRAIDGSTGDEVAVKVLDPAQRLQPVRVARFAREVGSLTRLSHPFIVRALRAGEAGGGAFLVMEYCPGGTLTAHLDHRALLSATSASVVIALAEAVEYAHREGVIHRDLKPSNILLGFGSPAPSSLTVDRKSFRPKVADFGLAKCAAELGNALTATRDVLGTPCYMAPDLATGARDADARTDVYGLGAILYECLTGQPPFVGPEPLEVVRMIREDPPVRPSAINRNVPAELEAICLKCLEKEPDDRYQTAAAVAEAICRAKGIA